jgi:hypothetical protein
MGGDETAFPPAQGSGISAFAPKVAELSAVIHPRRL